MDAIFLLIQTSGRANLTHRRQKEHQKCIIFPNKYKISFSLRTIGKTVVHCLTAVLPVVLAHALRTVECKCGKRRISPPLYPGKGIMTDISVV